jgi:hypothetical protein
MIPNTADYLRVFMFPPVATGNSEPIAVEMSEIGAVERDRFFRSPQGDET